MKESSLLHPNGRQATKRARALLRPRRSNALAPKRLLEASPSATMRILITGAAGFLGSHLCDRFIHEGYEVIGMDNMLTGSASNIEHLFPKKNFTFYHHDVTKYVHVPGPIDYILHFASPASPIDYLEMPIHTLKVGSLGTHHLLGLARNKRSVFMIASTSEVYGDPLQHPQTEDYWGNVNPIGPRGVYDEAKRFQESMTMAYHRVHNIDTRIVRIFNTYGPRMRMNDGRALPTFFAQALHGEELTVFGEGNQTRSFCYVTDMIEGIYRLLHTSYHEPVNMGNPEEVSILELAQLILDKVGNPEARIGYRELPEDDPQMRQPDISLAKNLLNWAPKTSLDQGLNLTLEYFKR